MEFALHTENCARMLKSLNNPEIYFGNPKVFSKERLLLIFAVPDWRRE
jgi:hypothetical protein